MSQTRTLVLFAGTALSLGGFNAALAQSSLDQSRAYQAELMADAQGRTSLLNAAQQSGHDGKGFVLSDATGNYRLKIGGQVQFRYMINVRNEEEGEGADTEDEDFTSGFQTRRTRLEFGGNIINPDFTFYVQSEFNRDGGGAGLLDAWGKYKFENGWALRWGQFKLPLLREELVSSKRQLAADRSVVNFLFTQSRSQGIEASWEGDAFRFFGAFSDGLATLNTDFDSSAEADYALTGRVEWKWAGDWADFDDFTSWQNGDNAGMVGGAVHYQGGGDTGGTSDVDILRYTADVSFEGNGWNAFAAFIGSNSEAGGDDEGADTEDTDDFGFLIQGGIFVTSQAELFARYDIAIPDDVDSEDFGGDEDEDDNFSTITVGTNYYFSENSHAAKLTADLQWFLDEANANSIGRQTAVGVLPSDEDSQFAIRLQFQLLF